MFSFAHSEYLLLLLLVPLITLLFWAARNARKSKLGKFGKTDVITSLMPMVSIYKPYVKICLELLALIFIIIAFARPWGGLKDAKTVKEGIEVVIAVDASNSMLASSTDDPAGPDRMRTAKLILEKLINRLDNDRVGLIVYAAESYMLIPVTNDYASAKMFLNSIEPSMVPQQGTDISSAINMAANSFSDNKDVGKAIILITDAEELEDENEVLSSVENAKKKNIQTDVVGVGSSVAVTIPENGKEMIDETTGMPVKTALNQQLASEIAKKGGGVYVNASSSDALKTLESQLSTLKKSAMESSTFTKHDELFGFFAVVAIILIIINIFILDRKIPWFDKISFFKTQSNRN